ncbi:hypothetical protein QVD17_29791 [Tagetes erecta]|uniref:Transposase n=1 Tax=Tagetes erecta TaxID=13708 RepID=A0AAD8K293_TARER|nr:hypothetical protein QVD17_29791 [Tagetes erecta]
MIQTPSRFSYYLTKPSVPTPLYALLKTQCEQVWAETNTDCSGLSAMWILMLVMMVIPLTRKRTQEHNSAPLRIQSVANGSSSEIVQQPTRKRNRRLPNVQANAAVAPIPQPAAVAPIPQAPIPQPDGTQPPVKPLKRRGKSLNVKASVISDEGCKINLTMDSRTKGFVGTSSTLFATECGIVIRNTCPMKYHKWDSIPADVKDKMHEKLETRFNLLRSDRVFMAYVNDKLQCHWKRFRCRLHTHWKNKEGETNPGLARSKMSSSCRSLADWDHLCDYWELESTMNYSRKMAINRGKQVIASRGGSRSIANHVFQMTDRETQMLPSPLEVYHKLHFNAKKQEWQNDDARIQYDNIIRHKEEAVAKLVSEGTTITTTMHHELENDAIQSVCAKEKTIKSAWKVGVGPVLRKKDFWMTSEAESSRPPSNENETLRNKVASLEKKSEEYEKKEERYEKLLMFMSSKFPDFESVISEPVSSGEVGMDEQLYEDNRSIDSLI